MPKKLFISLIILAVLVGGVFYLWTKFKGAQPVFRTPDKNIIEQIPGSSEPNVPEAINNTEFPLTLPKGFAISIFAQNLPGARDMVMDNFGNLWVSQTKEGKIVQLEVKDGLVVRKNEVFKNLNNPHGLAIEGTMLYFAEETKVSRVALYSDGQVEKLTDLPKGGRHYTRSLLFGSDGRLYISIGSSCDVCYEKDERLAAIYSMNKDGSDFSMAAKGLRNSVFMAINPADGKIWATEMGRDNLGDNLPPDEINIISVQSGVEETADNQRGLKSSSGRAAEPLDFGWPVCYGKNIHDINFDKNTYIQNPCSQKTPSYIDLPAHSAPLGLSFIPESGWPEEMQNDLILAFHGSWNRTEPTGYKIVRIKLGDKGEYLGMDSTGSPQVEDFIFGWLSKDGKSSLGRPVDVLALPGGIMYISDDKAGVIYKLQYLPSAKSNSQTIYNLNIATGQKIMSPVEIIGVSRGGWYFEGSFPVEVLDQTGKVIGGGIAQATKDWMTKDPVPFKASVTFTKPNKESGSLVFKKDNPSGLLQYDDKFILPIKF